MKKIELLVKNIYCSDCSKSIELELKKNGVKNVHIQIDCSGMQKMFLQYNQSTKKRDILSLLEKRGIELISIKKQ
ncbi:MAG: hypothetical protein AABX96_05290 [Nanoarchaeota archaeon]